MQPLLLLHGAIGAAGQLATLADLLKDSYQVHTMDFSGHGTKDYGSEPYGIATFANDVLSYMEAQKLQQVTIFGYSMGGYVGMYLAKNHPEKVNKLITLASKFHWDAATAEKETQMLNTAKIEEKVPAFAAALAKRHAPKDWKEVFERTKIMLRKLGEHNTLNPEDYSGINTPALILLGDRDKMVTLQETVDVYKALPNAAMGMLPNTHHPIEQVDIKALTFAIKHFVG